ncbi:hypothetical protein MFIFM68171_05726 [Madurella fahalii]|uniref:Uncharacterized protein n=1 Tax=Madurella fahalii TaxID=1157608 RepID=A0ABQ0GCN7_9PEZI
MWLSYTHMPCANWFTIPLYGIELGNGLVLDIVGIIDNQEPVISTLAQSCLDEQLSIRLIVVNPRDLELPANLTVGILEHNGIDSGDPEDMAVGVLVPDLKGSLKRDLSLSNASEALDSSPLAVVLIGTRRNSLKKLH